MVGVCIDGCLGFVHTGYNIVGLEGGLGLNGFKAGYCGMEVLIWLILARGIGNLGDLKAERAQFQRLRVFYFFIFYGNIPDC